MARSRPVSVNRRWTNWAGTASSVPRRWFSPATLEELTTIVNSARESGARITTVGRGHSPNAIARPTDWAVSLERYDRVLDLDDAGHVTVQAGATLDAINVALAARGRALVNLGSISGVTVGGAISTGTHGTGWDLGPLHTQVERLTLLTAGGNLLELARDRDLGVFRAALCALGALGIVERVTLCTVPAFKIHERTVQTTFSAVVADLDRLARSAERFLFLWFPYTELVSTRCLTPVGADTPTFERPAGPSTSVLEPAREDRGCRTLDEILAVLFSRGVADREVVARINRAAFAILQRPLERVVDSVRALNIDCGGQQYVLELAVEFGHAAAFLSELKVLVESGRHPAHFPVEVRFSAADDAFLSPTQSDDPTARFCWVGVIVYRPPGGDVPEYAAYFQAVERLGRSHGARVHWAKLYWPERAALAAVYPHLSEFEAVRRGLDPSGVFANDFVRRCLDLEGRSEGASPKTR